MKGRGQMKLPGLAVMAALFPSISAADDLAWNFVNYPPGSYAVYQNNYYFRTHVIIGQDILGTQVEVHQGKPPYGGVDFTYWLDARGRTIREKYASGQDFRYIPHNCRGVVGVCHYVRTNHRVEAAEMTSTIEPAGDGYDIQVVNEAGATVLHGHYVLDAEGFKTTGTQYSTSGNPIVITLLAVVLAP